jgi:hypothetical protein
MYRIQTKKMPFLGFLGLLIGFWGQSQLHAGGGDIQGPETGVPAYSLFYSIPDGPNGSIYSLHYDSSSNILYAGGAFTSFLSGTTQGDGHVAALNLTTMEWEEVGEGLTGDVYDLIMFQDTLYAAGYFEGLTGIPTGVAKLTPNGWKAVGYLNDTVFVLQEFQGALYAGGNFVHNVPGFAFMHLAKWQQNQWSSPGFAFNGRVRAMTVWGQHLVIGGDFSHAGIGEAKHIFIWNGQYSTAIGDPGGPVHALAVHQNNLWAGGPIVSATDTFGLALLDTLYGSWENKLSINTFNHNGTLPASTLHSMGIKTLNVISNEHPDFQSQHVLYAGGNFLYEPSPQVGRRGKNAARMDMVQGMHGDTWADSTIFEVVEADGKIFLAGAFTQLNGVSTQFIAYSNQEVTGLETAHSNDPWVLFPNPSQGNGLYLKTPEGMEASVQVRLLDLSGRLLWEGLWNHSTPLKAAEMLEKGIYLIQLPNHGQQFKWINN